MLKRRMLLGIIGACLLLSACNHQLMSPLPETGTSLTEPGVPAQEAPVPAIHTPQEHTGFRFVVMGDSRGQWGDAVNEATLRKLLEQLKKRKPQPNFVLFTGDQIKGSNVDLELAQWKEIVDDYFPLQQYYPTLGNHENDEKLFSKHFPHLPKDQLPGYQRTVYSFDYQNARFIVLNSNRMDDKDRYIVDVEQRNYLENKLKGSHQAYHFVMLHVPAYPSSVHYGKSLDAKPAERDAFWGLLDRYKVSAVFVGHEHNYSRRAVDSSFSSQFQNQVYQLTVGGAGAPLYAKVKDRKNIISGPKAVYHYMVVDVNAGQAEFKVYDIDNNQIDHFLVAGRSSNK